MASNKFPGTGLSIIEIFNKLGHILVVFGFILHLIGFATPYWRVLPFRWDGRNGLAIDLLEDGHDDELLGFDEGIWRKCANGLCSDIDIAGRDWLQAVRVFESIAILGSLVAIVTVLLEIFVKKLAKNKILYLLCVISCFTTALFMLLGVITYGAFVTIGISWSYGLVTVGGILIGIAGGFLLVAFIKQQSAPF